MIVAEIRPEHLNDWRGQLVDTETNSIVGEEWRATQRGELIGRMRSNIPLTHLKFKDVSGPGRAF
jgi:hypothetical protein